MGLRAYLSLIGLGTFLAWIAWGIILLNINPFDAGFAEFVMFYVTLAVALVGTLTLIMTVVRVYLLKRKVLVREIRMAFRHSVLFSVIAIVSLALSAAEKFTVWYAILLIAVAAIVEYFFLQFHGGRG